MINCWVILRSDGLTSFNYFDMTNKIAYSQHNKKYYLFDIFVQFPFQRHKRFVLKILKWQLFLEETNFANCATTLMNKNIFNLLRSIQFWPAWHKRGVKEILGELGIPLGHSPASSKGWGWWDLQKFSAKTIVPFEPVVLGNAPRNGPGLPEVFGADLKLATRARNAGSWLRGKVRLFWKVE